MQCLAYSRWVCLVDMDERPVWCKPGDRWQQAVAVCRWLSLVLTTLMWKISTKPTGPVHFQSGYSDRPGWSGWLGCTAPKKKHLISEIRPEDCHPSQFVP